MIYSGDLKDQEKSLKLITRIARELENVHYEHADLIKLTVNLRTTALTTAQESLYYTGIQSFNFDQDIVSTILAKPLSPDKMKGVLHPFLKIEENRRWSPLTVFSEQNIIEEREEPEAYHFIEADEDLERDRYRKWIAEKYAQLMESFLEAYEDGNANTLKQWMVLLEKVNPELIKKRYFYSFWLMMHQYSPLTYDEYREHEGNTILKDVLHQIGNKQFVVEDMTEIVRFDSRYSIQNMKIVLKEPDNE